MTAPLQPRLTCFEFMAAVDDEPMRDAGVPAPASQPLPKPRRRFAPQLVEENTRSSNPKKAAAEYAGTAASHPSNPKDASAQVDDTEMLDSPPPSSTFRRPFAALPIETVFASHRLNNNAHGPTAELTPDPSPTTSDTPANVKDNAKTRATAKKRFAPQLIETSSRTRRAGQQGLAARQSDKTDVTPGGGHSRGASEPWRKLVTRPPTGTEDDSSPRYLTPRRQPSMKPHPNTRCNTKTSSYHPDLDTIISSESSEEENEPEKTRAPTSSTHSASTESWCSRNYALRDRRESCHEDFAGYLLAVAAKEAYRQRELDKIMSAFPNGVAAQGVEHFITQDDSEDDASPAFPLHHGTKQNARQTSTDTELWAIKEARQHAERLATGQQSPKMKMSIDQELIHLNTASPPADPLWTTGSASRLLHASGSKPTRPPFPRGLRERENIESGAKVTHRRFGVPPAMRANREDAEMRCMRNAAAPPMLGKDLKFRLTPSPQQTRLEPDHPYSFGRRPEEKQRDVTGATGLWNGYCSAKANQDETPTDYHRMRLIATPNEPSTPVEPSSGSNVAAMARSCHTSQSSGAPPQQSEPHLLSGIDEGLCKERARKNLEERIRTEFNDGFVTQVYNYISLGYPATARAFDEELSRISGVAVSELRKDDHQNVGKGFMLQMEVKVGRVGDGKSVFGDERVEDGAGDGDAMRSPEEDELRDAQKPPRWRALKLYVREWARQHPSISDDGYPQAWDIQARKGSWAI